jgi:hypothetical protein
MRGVAVAAAAAGAVAAAACGAADPAHYLGVGAVGPDAAAAVSRLELNASPADPGQQQVFGRFQAARPNELWTGDALHGPVIGGQKAFLFWNLPWLSSGRPGG